MENRSRAEVQVRRIVSDYELGELIGRGAFSEVFKARHLEKGGIYAVKVMNNRILTENVKVKQYIRSELAIHNVLQPSAHVVRFYELLQTKNNCYFVYEYCEGGNLYELLQQEGALEEKRALDIFLQLVDGLKILRNHKIMHRDLKPENILVKEGNFKLADFGFSKELGMEGMTRTMLGSPLYMAPEVLRGEAYTANADVWSVGVILYEMLQGHCPFQSNSIASLISTIDDNYLSFDPSKQISANIRQFITKCLQKDCRTRMSWENFFEQASRLGNKVNPSYMTSSHQIFPEGLKKLTMKSNHSTIEESIGRSIGQKKSTSHMNQSKSKYEIYKQNYSRLQTEGVKNEIQTPLHKIENLKTEKTLFIAGKREVSKEKENEKEKGRERVKQSKISYNQLVRQHETCFNILRAALETLQKKDKKNYGVIRGIIVGVRKVMQKMFIRINVEEAQMLPVLSMVKYELIQLQKVQGELQRYLAGVSYEQLAEKEACLQPHMKDIWNKYQVLYESC